MSFVAYTVAHTLKKTLIHTGSFQCDDTCVTRRASSCLNPPRGSKEEFDERVRKLVKATSFNMQEQPWIGETPWVLSSGRLTQDNSALWWTRWRAFMGAQQLSAVVSSPDLSWFPFTAQCLPGTSSIFYKILFHQRFMLFFSSDLKYEWMWVSLFVNDFHQMKIYRMLNVAAAVQYEETLPKKSMFRFALLTANKRFIVRHACESLPPSPASSQSWCYDSSATLNEFLSSSIMAH